MDEHVPTPSSAIDPRDAQIAELTARITDLETNWKRAAADLANFRRQAEEEKQSFARFAHERTLLAILPVFDNFERIAAHLPDDFKASDAGKGFDAVKMQFEQALKSTGLTPVEVKVGDTCDPAVCQAIGMGPGASGTIIDIFETGYRLAGKVIRTAKVRVGDGSSSSHPQ